MQWGHFACPSSSQKRESTAFDLILQSALGLSSPGKQVGRSSAPCRKRSQVWGRESERWPKYYAIESPVLEMGSNLKNKLSAVRVNGSCLIFMHDSGKTYAQNHAKPLTIVLARTSQIGSRHSIVYTYNYL